MTQKERNPHRGMFYSYIKYINSIDITIDKIIDLYSKEQQFMHKLCSFYMCILGGKLPTISCVVCKVSMETEKPLMMKKIINQ